MPPECGIYTWKNKDLCCTSLVHRQVCQHSYLPALVGTVDLYYTVWADHSCSTTQGHSALCLCYESWTGTEVKGTVTACHTALAYYHNNMHCAHSPVRWGVQINNMLTSKEGQCDGHKGNQDNVDGSVDEASDKAIGHPPLHQLVLNHIIHRHRINLQQAFMCFEQLKVSETQW